MLLTDLLKAIQRKHRLAKLTQLERDFADVVARIRRERDDQTVQAVAERLRESIDKTQQRLASRPADRATIGYDLTQSNRAARDRNDQVAFSALTLSVIHWRAQQLTQSIQAPHNSAVSAPGQSRSERSNAVEHQAERFIAQPAGGNG